MRRTGILSAILALLLLLPGLSLANAASDAPTAVYPFMRPEVGPEDGIANLAAMGDAFASHEAIEVQSLAKGLLLLSSGRAAAFHVFEDVARYVARINAQYEVAFSAAPPLTLHLVATEENAALIEDVNTAMETLAAGGVLDALWAAHVTAVLDGGEPEAIALPTFAEADILRVGVSGDCPPIDYIAPDGTPMGYNVAFLAALGEALGVNIDLVTIDSGARFTALAAGTIDLFFWQIGAVLQENLPVELYDEMVRFVTLDGAVLASDAYATQEMAYIVPKAQ